MPAFGCNRFTLPFVFKVQREPVKGFRLSDRIVSALDQFVGYIIPRFSSAPYPALNRFAFIYPFVGATDWTHSLNLADIDGGFEKYKVSWSGATHDQFGAVPGNSNTGADVGLQSGPQAENFYYKAFGFYSRSNVANTDRTMTATTPVQPQDGRTYTQGIHPRFVDGSAYFQHIISSHPSQAQGGVYCSVAVSDSLGLFVSSRMNGTDLRGFKRGAQIAFDVTNVTVGMGYGVLPGAFMMLMGTRSLGFVFSTKHMAFFTPAEIFDFNFFVEQLMKGLARNV